MGQVGKFFQNQRPKKACRAQGRGGAGDDAVWFLVWVCSHACTRMESRLVPCTRLGLGVQSCQWRWRFWEKKPTGYLYRAGFLVSQVGSVLKESAEVSKIKRVEQKVKLPPAPVPNSSSAPKFFSQTQKSLTLDVLTRRSSSKNFVSMMTLPLLERIKRAKKVSATGHGTTSTHGVHLGSLGWAHVPPRALLWAITILVQLDVVVHTHNPSIHKDETGGSEFKVSLGYIVRFYLRMRTKPGVVVHTFNSSPREEKAGGSLFQVNLVYMVSSRSARAAK